MSNEKIRDQFEAWVKANWPNQSLERFNPLHGVTEGEYTGFTVQHCWDAWQASRAAIEVELPDVIYWGSSESNEGYDADEMKSSITALGLRIKP